MHIKKCTRGVCRESEALKETAKEIQERKVDKEILKTLVRMATKKKKAPVVYKNAGVLNVFTETVEKSDVAVWGDYIVGVGSYSGESEIDCRGEVIVPAFCDAHLHVESSMVRPFDFIECAMKSGTLTFIVDPHEAANVKGEAGIKFILDDTAALPANVYVMLPSCVPAVKGELNGCEYTAGEMKKLIFNPRVAGLGEVMDTAAVSEGEDSMMDKLSLFSSRNADGHMIRCSEETLQALVACGVCSDHESDSFEEAYAKYCKGIFIAVREGSTARNIRDILPEFIKRGLPTDNMGFCTDDKHIKTILDEGHILHNVNEAMSTGLSFAKAVKMATYNVCRHYGLRRCGAILPGYRADFLTVRVGKEVELSRVVCHGKDINDYDFDSLRPKAVDPALLNTVNIAPVKSSDLALKCGTLNDVIEIIPGQLVTNHLRIALPQKDGLFVPNREYAKLAVIERHKATGKVGVCAVKGFNIGKCAMASTVGHDSHNVIVAGDNDADMLRAIGLLKEQGGGFAVVSGEDAIVLPLEIMGLMTDDTYVHTAEILEKMHSFLRQHGLDEKTEPFTTLSFLSLPVIPFARLTPSGFIGGEQFGQKKA